MPLLRKLALCPLLLGVVLLGLAGLVQADAPRELWHQSIGKGYGELTSATAHLSATIASHCSSSEEQPQPDNLDSVRKAWLSAFLAWQAVRFVDFGPIEQNSRHWQLQFWPDPKNLVGRKVDYWLDGAMQITPAAIEDGGVAMQGFPALEYVLFADSPSELTQRQCTLAAAISTHIHEVARLLEADWQKFGNFYQQQDGYGKTTVNSVINALEILVDKRIAAPMGLGGNTRRNPYLGDAWRSGKSLTTLQASLEGLRDYFLPGLKRRLGTADQQALYTRFAEQLDETLAEFDNLPGAMKPLLEDDDGYSALQSLFIKATQLRQLASGPLAQELGIVKGFNSSDGD